MLLEGLKQINKANPVYFVNLLIKDSSSDDLVQDQISMQEHREACPGAPRTNWYQGRRYGVVHSRVSKATNRFSKTIF